MMFNTNVVMNAENALGISSLAVISLNFTLLVVDIALLITSLKQTPVNKVPIHGR